MDTYGYPKKAWTLDGEPINLEKDFPELINASAGVVQREDPVFLMPWTTGRWKVWQVPRRTASTLRYGRHMTHILI